MHGRVRLLAAGWTVERPSGGHGKQIMQRYNPHTPAPMRTSHWPILYVQQPTWWPSPPGSLHPPPPSPTLLPGRL